MIKQTGLKLLMKTGAFSVFRRINRSKTPILMYHRFSEGDEVGKTSRKAFEAHLGYLTKHYKVISLTEAVANGSDERTVVLTVDDGYRDFYDIALPALQKFGVSATLYVVTGFVDQRCWIWTDKARYLLNETTAERFSFTIGHKQFDEQLGGSNERFALAGRVNNELKKIPDPEKEIILNELAKELGVELDDVPPAEFGAVTWDQIRDLARSGIEIGSHTVYHPILTNVDDERLAKELATSKAVLEEMLQSESKHFCYPNGNVSTRERDAVENAGYVSAVTTEIRLRDHSDDHFLLPRVDTEPDLVRLVQSTSGFDAIKAKYR